MMRPVKKKNHEYLALAGSQTYYMQDRLCEERELMRWTIIKMAPSFLIPINRDIKTK